MIKDKFLLVPLFVAISLTYTACTDGDPSLAPAVQGTAKPQQGAGLPNQPKELANPEETAPEALSQVVVPVDSYNAEQVTPEDEAKAESLVDLAYEPEFPVVEESEVAAPVVPVVPVVAETEKQQTERAEGSVAGTQDAVIERQSVSLAMSCTPSEKTEVLESKIEFAVEGRFEKKQECTQVVPSASLVVDEKEDTPKGCLARLVVKGKQAKDFCVRSFRKVAKLFTKPHEPQDEVYAMGIAPQDAADLKSAGENAKLEVIVKDAGLVRKFAVSQEQVPAKELTEVSIVAQPTQIVSKSAEISRSSSQTLVARSAAPAIHLEKDQRGSADRPVIEAVAAEEADEEPAEEKGCLARIGAKVKGWWNSFYDAAHGKLKSLFSK